MVRQTSFGAYRISPKLYDRNFQWYRLANYDATMVIFGVVYSYRIFLNYDIMTLVAGKGRTIPKNQ